jgi:hypothetical protein
VTKYPLQNVARKLVGYLERRWMWWKISRIARKEYSRRPDLHAAEAPINNVRLARQSIRSAESALEMAEHAAESDDPLGTANYVGTAFWKIEIARLQLRDGHRRADSEFSDETWENVVKGDTDG